MKTYSFLISLACVVVFYACVPISYEHKTFDLDAVHSERDIKMSDLADNLRVVPLESDKDFIVSSDSKNWVNDKYIIVFGKNTIEQFSSEDGSHIRTLARKGDGIDGFDYCINNPIVDDAKQVLYLTKVTCDTTLCIDLNTGMFLPHIKSDHKSEIDLSEIDLVDISDSESRITDDYLQTTNDNTLVSGDGSDFVLKRQDIVLHKYTLYTIIDEIPSPSCSFVIKDEINSDNSRKVVSSFDIEYVDSKSIIASLVETKMKEGRSWDETTRMIVDRENTQIAKLEKFIINPSFEYEGTFRSPSFFRGKTIIAYAIESFALRDCLEDALSSDTFSSSSRNKLETLCDQLSEDSNPVYIIGTKK